MNRNLQADGAFSWLVLREATVAEAEAGTRSDRVITPRRLRSAMNAGGSAPLYACRAWVSFNGGTGAINTSGNVSSITKNGTGDYTVNYANSMPSNAHSVVCNARGTSALVCLTTLSSTSARITLRISTSANATDQSLITFAAFR